LGPNFEYLAWFDLSDVFRSYQFTFSFDLYPLADFKIRALEPKFLRAMTGNVVWNCDVNEGVDQIVDATTPLALQVFRL
jgi:hypothetical protein